MIETRESDKRFETHIEVKDVLPELGSHVGHDHGRLVIFRLVEVSIMIIAVVSKDTYKELHVRTFHKYVPIDESAKTSCSVQSDQTLEDNG